LAPRSPVPIGEAPLEWGACYRELRGIPIPRTPVNKARGRTRICHVLASPLGDNVVNERRFSLPTDVVGNMLW
jgi:hypothetical protein